MKLLYAIACTAIAAWIIGPLTINRLLQGSGSDTLLPLAGPAPGVSSFRLEPGLAAWSDAAHYIHHRESHEGTDPNCRVVGPDGEMGEYRQRPIFVRDIKRLTGRTYDPWNPSEAHWATCVALAHYAPLAGLGPDDGEELAAMYRLGFAGYMDKENER